MPACMPKRPNVSDTGREGGGYKTDSLSGKQKASHHLESRCDNASNTLIFSAATHDSWKTLESESQRRSDADLPRFDGTWLALSVSILVAHGNASAPYIQWPHVCFCRGACGKTFWFAGIASLPINADVP